MQERGGSAQEGGSAGRWGRGGWAGGGHGSLCGRGTKLRAAGARPGAGGLAAPATPVTDTALEQPRYRGGDADGRGGSISPASCRRAPELRARPRVSVCPLPIRAHAREQACSDILKKIE